MNTTQNQINQKNQTNQIETQGQKQTSKSPSEWVDWYVAHGGERDLKLAPDEHILFHPEHGFITFFFYDDVLELHHMTGDGKFWQGVLMKIMKAEGIRILRAFTKRNPKAWQRKYGGHIRGYYMEADIDELKN